MTPPRTILGTLTSWGPLSRPWPRRVLFAAVIAVLAVLCLVPRRHIATVLLNQPTSNAGTSLGALLGQLGGGYASLLGGGQPYEVNLAVARSYAVEVEVLRRMKLLGTPGYETLDRAVRKLRHHVEVNSLRGAIVEIDVRSPDPEYALRVASTYSEVIRERLATLGREQTAYKRQVLEDRLRSASQQLSRAQGAVDRFRASNAIPDLQSQLAGSVGALAALQARLQVQRAQLQAALRFATPNSYAVQRLQADVASLERQIAVARAGRSDSTAAGLAAKSNRYIDLQRDLQYAQSLYVAYTRSLEQAAVENETADWNVQALQPPYLQPGLHPNPIPLGLLILAMLIFAACEIYLFAPGRAQRPPSAQ